MYRVVDLDQAGKESDGFVFLLSVGGEKVGFSDVEIAEMLRARPATKGKKAPARKGASSSESEPTIDPVTEPSELAASGPQP